MVIAELIKYLEEVKRNNRDNGIGYLRDERGQGRYDLADDLLDLIKDLCEKHGYHTPRV